MAIIKKNNNLSYANQCIWAVVIINCSLLPLTTCGLVRINLKRVHPHHQSRKLSMNKVDDYLNENVANYGEKGASIVYLKNYMSSQFVGEIGIGTPAQKFSVIFDTAVPFLWVPSSNCNSSACASHPRYYSSNSSTYTEIGTPYEIIYGTEAKLSGLISQDNVQVGNLLVKNQIFLETSIEESQTLVLAKFDAVVGLAFSEKSYGKKSFIWQTMAEQGLLSKKIFSIWFNPNLEAELGGEIVFGGVDPNHFKGKHTYVPVIPSQDGVWQIEMGDFFIGEHSSGYCKEGCAALLDSGSPLLSGPKAIVIEINHAIGAKGVKSIECKEVVSQFGETIHNLLASGVNSEKICPKLRLCTINRAQYMRNDLQERENRRVLSSVADEKLCSACQMTVIWIQNQMKQRKSKKEILSYVSKLCQSFPTPAGDVVVPCDRISRMPNLTLTIGNKPFTFTPRQYIRVTEERNKAVCRSQFSAVDLPNSPGTWIFGNVFMGVYHSVFDFGNQRAGFAEIAY